MTLTRFGRFVRGALYLQSFLVPFVALGYLFGWPSFGEGGMDSRKVAAFIVPFAILLFLAARRLAGDSGWLHPVIAVVAANLADTVYELFVRGDTSFVPAMAMESAFLAVYVAGALHFARTSPVRARARAAEA